tara:strand:+ start:124 stop:348 length:225 start_codon:yes stop_codon:yes gene_type:complete
MKDIFYSGGKAYHVVRTIKIEDCNPKNYGIDRGDEEAYMKVLKVWRDSHNCDHVLRQNNSFMLCRTIKDAQIIE